MIHGKNTFYAFKDGSFVKTTRIVNHTRVSVQTLNKQQYMDLQSAKKSIVERSRKEPKKLFYLNVDEEGEVNIVTEFDVNASGFCYKNGSEIALPDITTTVAPKKGKTKNKQTAAAENAETMSTKKNNKKAVKKSAADRPAMKTVAGDKKSLTVKTILNLMKKGDKVYRQSNPNAGGILIQKRLAKYANQEKEIAVIVVKK